MGGKKKVLKNAAAVELGRLGGLKQVPKGFSKLTPEQRKDQARAAAAARWGTKKRANKAAKKAKKPGDE
jgi:hypothetical protein